MYQRILKQFCKNYPFWRKILHSFYGDAEEHFNTLHSVLLKEGNKNEISFFYQLLKIENYQFFHTLLLCISSLCNATYKKTENYFMEQYLHSPFIEKISKQENIYTIKSILRTIKIQKAPLFFEQLHLPILSRVAKEKKFSDYCHDSACFVCQSLKESNTCTCLCPQAFFGQYYHSFTIYKDYAIDLNYNCVVPKKQYFSLLQAEPLQILSHEEIEILLKPLSSISVNLLYSAMEEQIKKRVLK